MTAGENPSPKCPGCDSPLYQALVHVSGERFTVGSVSKLVWACEQHGWYWDSKGQPWNPEEALRVTAGNPTDDTLAAAGDDLRDRIETDWRPDPKDIA